MVTGLPERTYKEVFQKLIAAESGFIGQMS